ncbi:hypothetical protein GCM10011600_02300 [Pseudolysinimonas yzui]|uniref:Uncharacterized protein n=1 Tax=Pseudolysinimonas yzui TaxID=2708254 RepID=A0A8J3GMS3_9MICO|nr:hypothetical protein GCM10011600_02300 [Pseudolysinimonas yzui]
MNHGDSTGPVGTGGGGGGNGAMPAGWVIVELLVCFIETTAFRSLRRIALRRASDKSDAEDGQEASEAGA